MSLPTERTLHEQMGRHLAAASPSLVFCEAADNAAGRSVFAGTLPEAAHRELSAIVISASPNPAGGYSVPQELLGVEIRCVGATKERVAERLRLVEATFNRFFPAGEVIDQQNASGVIGRPEMTDGDDVPLWRVLSIEAVQSGIVLDALTDEGQVMGTAVFQVACVARTWRAYRTAFGVFAEPSTTTSATIAVSSEEVTASLNGEVTVSPLAGRTVGDVRADLGAAGFITIQEFNTSILGEPADRLLQRDTTDVLGTSIALFMAQEG